MHRVRPFTFWILLLAAAPLAAVEPDLSQHSYGSLSRAVAEADLATAMALVRAIPASGRSDLYDVAVDALAAPRPGVAEAGLDAIEAIGGDLLAANLREIRTLVADRGRDPRLRWLAARLLGEIEDDGAIEVLIYALDDEDKVAFAAKRALVEIMQRDLGDDPQRWRAAYDEWRQEEQTIIPRLIATIEAEDATSAQRLTALNHLLHLKSHRTMVGDFLASLAEDPDPKVRGLARAGLRNLGGVAVLYHPEVAAMPAPSAEDLATYVGESEAAIAENRAARAEQNTEAAGGSGTTSRIITILVVLLALGGIGYGAYRSTQRQQPKPPKRRGGGGSGGPATESEKKRISFTN